MKVCIARVDRMGDMVLTLPIIKGLKLIDKTIIIHVIASEKNYKIVKHFNYIDKIFLLKNSNKNFFSILNKIRKENFDYYYNFSPNWSGFFLGVLSKSKVKSTLILLSRYNKSFSKLTKRVLGSIFYNFKVVIDRFTAFRNNESFHQTTVMFSLIKKNSFAIKEDVKIDYFFPSKYKIVAPEDFCILHLTSRWINKYYNEENFIDLINQLQQKKMPLYLTSDESTKFKFKKIFDKYSIINNDQFSNEILSKEIIIFDNLDFDKWIELIKVSKYVITPECGILHITSLCQNHLTVIYDADYFPEMMMHEYAPWKKQYNKLVFNDDELNQKIVSFVQ